MVKGSLARVGDVQIGRRPPPSIIGSSKKTPSRKRRDAKIVVVADHRTMAFSDGKEATINQKYSISTLGTSPICTIARMAAFLLFPGLETSRQATFCHRSVFLALCVSSCIFTSPMTMRIQQSTKSLFKRKETLSLTIETIERTILWRASLSTFYFWHLDDDLATGRYSATNTLRNSKI